MKPEETIGYRFRIITNLLKRNIDGKIDKFGEDEASSVQGMYIGYLFENSDKDIYQKDLEKFFNIRRSTATVLLNSMEKNGFILREKSKDDCRLKKIILTEKGKQRHIDISTIIENSEKQLIDGISPEDLKVFYSVCDRLTEKLKEKE